MVVYQFNNEPYRLFLALCASGLPQTDQFIHGTLQKHILREIRVTEAAVKGNVAWNNRSNRFTVTSDKITEAKNDQEGEGEDELGGFDRVLHLEVLFAQGFFELSVAEES